MVEVKLAQLGIVFDRETFFFIFYKKTSKFEFKINIQILQRGKLSDSG